MVQEPHILVQFIGQLQQRGQIGRKLHKLTQNKCQKVSPYLNKVLSYQKHVHRMSIVVVCFSIFQPLGHSDHYGLLGSWFYEYGVL